jgi:hypothetical protein
VRISADVEEAQSAYLDALRRGERPMSTAEIVASTVAKVGHVPDATKGMTKGFEPIRRTWRSRAGLLLGQVMGLRRDGP